MWQYCTYFRWDRLAHSHLPWRCDSRQVMPSLTSNPDWQECIGAFGDTCKYYIYFSDFQPLGRQSGSKISCIVSSCNGESTAGMAEVQQVVIQLYVLFEHFCHIHAICSSQPGKAWLGVNHTFAIGVNELKLMFSPNVCIQKYVPWLYMCRCSEWYVYIRPPFGEY